MSIDSLFIEDETALNYRESPWALIYEDGIWEKLQEQLGFDGYCRPDECEPIACMDEARRPRLVALVGLSAQRVSGTIKECSFT